MKCRDSFVEIKNSSGLQVELPALDVETSWSSTFTMVEWAFEARRLLVTAASRIEKLTPFAVSGVE